MLQEIELHVKQREDFAFETTLSGLTYKRFLQGIKNGGYVLHFYYLWIPDVELSLERVRSRVSLGGHNIPETDLRRRFDRSLRNFFVFYRGIADSWSLFDNSGLEPIQIAYQKVGNVSIMNRTVYEELETRYGK